MIKKERAVFTIVRNEPIFLRLWLNYYTRFFDETDVYVIDNSTDDGSVEDALKRHPRINIVSRPSERSFVHVWLKDTVQAFQRELLERYDVVVFAEADEFLIPKDVWSGLDSYLDWFRRSPQRYVRATAWSIVHQFERERPIRWDVWVKVLSERNSMWRMPFYDKTLITKIPLTYGRGFHRIYVDGQQGLDYPERQTDLELLHAWQIDIDQYHKRVCDRLKGNPAEKIHGHASIEQVRELFRTNTTPWDKARDEQQPYVGQEHPVPEHWKHLITW